jgi:hypothetical protein
MTTVKVEKAKLAQPVARLICASLGGNRETFQKHADNQVPPIDQNKQEQLEGE